MHSYTYMCVNMNIYNDSSAVTCIKEILDACLLANKQSNLKNKLVSEILQLLLLSILRVSCL